MRHYSKTLGSRHNSVELGARTCDLVGACTDDRGLLPAGQ
jgi:hypothetical protein